MSHSTILSHRGLSKAIKSKDTININLILDKSHRTISTLHSKPGICAESSGCPGGAQAAPVEPRLPRWSPRQTHSTATYLHQWFQSSRAEQRGQEPRGRSWADPHLNTSLCKQAPLTYVAGKFNWANSLWGYLTHKLSCLLLLLLPPTGMFPWTQKTI